MATAADKLTISVLKSVVVFLRAELPVEFVSPKAYITSQDFDHGTRPDGKARSKPYVALELESDRTFAYEIGNRKIQRDVFWNTWVVCEDFEQQLTLPQQVAQLFETADEDGVDGAIALYDFDTPTPTKVGFVEIMVEDILPFLDIDEVEREKSMKYASVIPCRVEEEKDKLAALLSVTP